MKLVGAGGQQRQDYLYRADATMTGSAQLVLGRSMSRSVLLLQNLGTHTMNVEIGCGRATATLTNGAVSSIAVNNAGFNFTKPPIVRLLGGGPPQGGNPTYLGLNQANGPAPSNIAQAHCVMTGSAGALTIASITVDNGGSGYLIAPYVFIQTDDLDPYGASAPSATSGMSLPASMATPIAFNGTFCPTEPVSVIGTGSDVLFCAWAE